MRRAADVPNGKAYRKYFDPWMICDWKRQYDPRPWDYWGRNGLEMVEPDPIWWYNRK